MAVLPMACLLWPWALSGPFYMPLLSARQVPHAIQHALTPLLPALLLAPEMIAARCGLGLGLRWVRVS